MFTRLLEYNTLLFSSLQTGLDRILQNKLNRIITRLCFLFALFVANTMSEFALQRIVVKLLLLYVYKLFRMALAKLQKRV
jgi:hypothetical protein